MDKKTQNKLKRIRQKIDNLDNKLLKILSKRFDYSKQISALKKGQNIQDTNRETALQLKWQKKSIKLNLNETFSAELLNQILTESKKIQSK